jgi:hypothetical protein
MALAGSGISQTAARTFIRDGIPELGMPAFGEKVTAEQLQTLAAFVEAMGGGAPPLAEYPLPTPAQGCKEAAEGCLRR